MSEHRFFQPSITDDEAPWEFEPDSSRWSAKTTNWRGKRVLESPTHGWYLARWQGIEFRLALVTLSGRYCEETRWYVIGPNEGMNRAFFLAVCEHHAKVRSEILVFEEATWREDKELFEAVQKSSLEDLVLQPGLKEEIVGDI